MNGPTVVSPRTTPGNIRSAAGAGVGGSEAMLNSVRIGMVADKLAVCEPLHDKRHFFQLCLSLARGIDYGVANSDVPDHASRLPPVLKQICSRKNELFLQAAIMVLMISVKNACKMGWFSPEDTDALLTLANEVGSDFGTLGNLNSEANSFMPNVSVVMSRFYPQLKLGHVIASLEVKPGYGTYAVDFHIAKDVSYSPEEKIRLFVASKDNMDTSACIISPQQANLLLNGKGVDRRTNVFMDPGPQLPSVVNPLLKYGTNLFQAVGYFDGHYIILIAFVSTTPASSLPAPQDYVQNDIPALCPGSDPELIEGPSRISLNCPISYQRIRTPVKGHLCKHYQCFDLNNYVAINSKRPSWRCPHCNQTICFTDIRVDKKMVKVLKEVGDNVSEVIISADGSWTAASSSNQRDESHEKSSDNQKRGLKRQHSSASEHLQDASCSVYDLTKEDDGMETIDICDLVDTKPQINHNVQARPITTTLNPPANGFNQHTSTQVGNILSSGASVYVSGNASYNMRPEAQNASIYGALTGNFGVSPVLTDAVSPALSQQPDHFHSANYMSSSNTRGQFSASHSLQMQELLNRQAIANPDFVRSHLIPRNVTRTPSAIQALPVQRPVQNSQEHPMPSVSIPGASGTSVPFQAPLHSNARFANVVAHNNDRPRHHPVNMSNMAATSMQNRPASQVMGPSTPSPNLHRLPQTLSQPPHLMRSSQVSRNHPQTGVSPGVGAGNTPSTVQRVNLVPQQTTQMRPSQTMPLQTQPNRMPSSVPLNAGVTPVVVSRTENLIDMQSEQNWRPTGRMRGSLTGQAYSAALSQFMGQSPQAQSPVTLASARPSTPSPLSQMQAMLANRMHGQTSQPPNLSPMPHAAAGPGGAPPERPGGVN